MLYAIIAVMVLLWLAGIATSALKGGLVQLLMIIAAFAIIMKTMRTKAK